MAALVGFVFSVPIIVEDIQIKLGNILSFSWPDFGIELLLFVDRFADFDEVAIWSVDGDFKAGIFKDKFFWYTNEFFVGAW